MLLIVYLSYYQPVQYQHCMLYFERFDLHYQSDSLQDLTQNKTVLTIALHHQDR
ncbi:hypothetical protein XM264_0354 [Enterococcus faecalis]|nr:hypothetical protein EFDM72_0448 [Enterococcus faecalis]OSH34175.1 hypothetical protein XJ76305_2698 [Enterococcus faecalis]OSH40264.1 hypothetical protein XM264_0354 [Enterococcus faecalis]